jgi:DNA polymerase-1
MTTRTILIDGDIALYEVTTACEQAIKWEDDFWTLHCDFKEAKQRFDCWVADVLEKTESQKAIIALSGPNNWRKDVLPTYKHNRKSKRKPLIFKELKEYVREVYRTFEFDNLEADDVLGLLAGSPGLGNIKGEKVIVTIDKDLMTVPGYHYYTNKPEDGIIKVTEDQADFNHYLQTLVGDSVDGYSGCPGIGPVRAERVLEYRCWGAVIEAYEIAGLTEQDALVQARVARILRWGEYNTKTKEVRLWNPK